MPKTGIIIPARNEEFLIARCLESLQPFQKHGAVIIVMDAHCNDQTASIAASVGVKVKKTKQPERGFAVAEGVEILKNEYMDCDFMIIAHADMQFKPNACEVFHDALHNYPDAVWGCFGHTIESTGIIYRIIENGNNLRARYCRFPYGDQAQFFRWDALMEFGFPRQPLYEDLELCYRFQHESRYIYLNNPVLISNRHWKQGIIRTTFRNWKAVYQYRKNRNNMNFSYNAG